MVAIGFQVSVLSLPVVSACHPLPQGDPDEPREERDVGGLLEHAAVGR